MTTATRIRRAAAEVEMLAEIERLNALALAAETTGEYEKWSNRANALEGLLTRSAARS